MKPATARPFKNTFFRFLWILLITPGLPCLAGDIVGTITEQGTGTPLASIDIDVFDANLQSVPTTAKSDASGNYSVTGLPAGNYIIRADPKASQGYVDQYNGGVFLRSQASFFAVPAVGSVIVNFSLTQGALINGNITIEGLGTPAANIDLDVFDQPTGEFISSVNASTDASGNYSIGAFPPGTYVLRADPDPSTFLVERFYLNGVDRSTATAIDIVGTADVNNIDFQVAQGGIIRGQILDAGTLTPLSGIDLDLFDTLGNFQKASAITSSTGFYELGPVVPGSYLVRADPEPASGYVRAYYPDSLFQSTASPVTVTVNTITPNIDIRSQQGGTISGAVVEQGTLTPLPLIDLDVFDATGNRMPVDAKTDATGSYLIGAVPAGNYTIRANPTLAQGYVTEYYNDVLLRTDATMVPVSVGMTTTGVNFQLVQGGVIQGVITGSDTSNPLSGIDLDLFDSQGQFLSALDATTSATGFYQLGPVPPGDWFLQADPTVAQGYVDEYYDGEYALARAATLTIVSATTLNGIDFVLDPGGTITGTIRKRSNNDPLPGVDLDVFFTDKRRVDVTAKTDASGNYTLGLLPVGQFIIRADPVNSSGFVKQYYNLAPSFDQAQPVTVNVGQTITGIDFLLDNGVLKVDNWALYK